MSMFLVGRHTRAEEESGRDELVRGRRRSAGTRRWPPRCSSLLVANVVFGGLVAA